MKQKYYLIFGIITIIGLILISGCVQQEIPTSIEFTFANEAEFDTTIIAHIDGEKVYEKELISHVTAGGYFGQEFEYKTLEVPNREFTLEVTESKAGFKETKKINPANGKYVSVTFWEDKFIIEQTKEKRVRID